jgi:chlorobactene glucosyltransferase
VTFVALAVLIVWVLAFARTLLNLAVVPRLRAGDAPASRPFVSIVVPARDEARVIERTVRALLAQTYDAFEVIVVDDRSRDDTGAILRRIAAGDARLIVINGEEPPPGWLGKPAALHRGAARARGELLLFVDADVQYAPAALTAAVAAFGRSGAGLVTLLPYFELETVGEQIAMPQLGMALFSGLPLWLSNRTRIELLAVGGGPGNLLRRDFYEQLGGHVPLRNEVVDDVGLARLVRRSGARTVAVRGDDLVSLRMYHGLAEVIDGFTKNAFAMCGRSYVIAVAVLAFTVVAHLLPFALLFVSPFRAIAAAIVVTMCATRVVLFRSLRYGMLNALLFHLPMTLVWLYIFLRSMWVTGVRGELRWRGRTYGAAR